MSVTEVQIVNLALVQIGEPVITDLSENTKAARLGSLWYAPARDFVLRSHPWNCATRRTQLTRLTTTPSFGYQYAYNLPTDLLRLLSIRDHTDNYEMEDGQILSNSTGPLYIRYIYQLKETSKFDAALVQAIAAYLAYELNNALARDPGRKQGLLESFKQKLSEARFVDATENSDRRFLTEDWLLARDGDEPFRPFGDT